jgi:hypothetical protein
MRDDTDALDELLNQGLALAEEAGITINGRRVITGRAIRRSSLPMSSESSDPSAPRRFMDLDDIDSGKE